jgi:predicted RNA binding protein YcfA (HicA-like mRNA interferase family)
MENIRVRDVKKALRLCGWVLVRVVGDHSEFVHPNVPESFIISGKGYDLVPPATLHSMERRVGLCFGRVLH